jgi:hypothetical protein
MTPTERGQARGGSCALVNHSAAPCSTRLSRENIDDLLGMDTSAASAAAAFLASLVEFIEALTIVLAVGAMRGWRGALSHGAGSYLKSRGAMIGYFWIGFGGALGSMGRAWLALAIGRITGPQFPWGTILDQHHWLVRHRLLRHPHGKCRARSRAGRCTRLCHGRRLRRIHHLLIIQSANAGTRARWPCGASSWQYRALGRALHLGRCGRALWGRRDSALVNQCRREGITALPVVVFNRHSCTTDTRPPFQGCLFSGVRAATRWSILLAALDFAPALWRLAWLKPVEPPPRPVCCRQRREDYVRRDSCCARSSRSRT